MGFWQNVLNSLPHVGVMTPNVQYIGGHDELAEYYNGGALDLGSPASLWRTQPHLRTVVSFVARNIAQLGLHSFERVDETDRRRDRTSAVARALAFPDGEMTTFDLIYALVGDMLLYDRAYWFIGNSVDLPSGWLVRRIPPSWVTVKDFDHFKVKTYRVSMDGKEVVTVPAEQILAFTGYSPTSTTTGSPTVEALRDTLREQVEAAKYRGQVWKRGGRVSAVLQRPQGVKWSDAAREAFREDWYAKYTGNGSKAGGTPILEDGMTLNRIDFSAADQQFVEAAKLSLATVAAAFHVNPTMIGQNDSANYSNVREFRKMLYGDTLGPLLAQIEARLNTFLLPRLGMDNARFYVEFNIAEKLQGDFEEQHAAMQTATGAPWMTRNEARARMNLPQLEDGDGLVTPLNVLIGGQASPNDSAPPKAKAIAPSVKARPESWEAKHTEVLRKFFRRQGAVVLSRLGGKADWWDEQRWNRELADDLYRLGVATSETAAKAALDEMGADPGTYNLDQTLAFLKARAQSGAENINAKTRERLEAAIEDEDGDPEAVFAEAQDSRSGLLAAALVTAAAGFGTAEAGKQSGAATKTWVTGANPRPEHAALDGETVKMSDNFSNGLAWPGDSAGGADEVAGCNCSISFGF